MCVWLNRHATVPAPPPGSSALATGSAVETRSMFRPRSMRSRRKSKMLEAMSTRSRRTERRYRWTDGHAGTGGRKGPSCEMLRGPPHGFGIGNTRKYVDVESDIPVSPEGHLRYKIYASHLAKFLESPLGLTLRAFSIDWAGHRPTTPANPCPGLS